jgi:hypothetical protein
MTRHDLPLFEVNYSGASCSRVEGLTIAPKGIVLEYTE